MADESTSITRRAVVSAGSVAGLTVGTAGCLFFDAGSATDPRSGPTEELDGSEDEGTARGTEGTPTWNDEPLELLHGWTGGNAADAMEALTGTFERHYPEMPVDFRPTGGSGSTTYERVISMRLENGNPPGIFASRPGKHLEKFADALGDVGDEVWRDGSLPEQMVPMAERACRHEGSLVAVPIGSFRLNNLFYNPTVLESAGVDPADLDTIDGFVSALDTVANETDAAPLAHGMKAPWTTLQLFATLLVGQEGPRSYRRAVAGNPDAGVIRRTMDTLATVLDGTLPDEAGTIGWNGAHQRLVEGDAAFLHQGAWAIAESHAADAERGTDWEYRAFPGTGAHYLAQMDAFVYPADDPTPEKATRWLEFAGSKTAQERFNAARQSVPLRTDASTDRFGDVQTRIYDAMRDADARLPSMTHGLALAPETLEPLRDAFAEIRPDSFDVDQVTTAVTKHLREQE